MAVTVRIQRDTPATDVATYTQIRLYSASTPGGSFALTGGTATLASTTYLYSISYSGSNRYFRYTLYNPTGAVESSQSETFEADGITVRNLRIEAAREAGAGFSSTCTSTGTTTTLIDTALRDDGVESTFLEGSWIYRPDAGVAGDKVRRVQEAGFTASSGTLTVARAWTNAPASAEEYHIFNFFPPIDVPAQPWSWDRAIRQAMDVTWYVDRVPLSYGQTTGQRQFSLTTILGQVSRDDVRSVWKEYTDSNSVITRMSCDREGAYWDLIENGRQDLVLDVYPPPRTDEVLVVEVNRRDAIGFKVGALNDTDVLTCPWELAWRAVVMRAYEKMNMLQPGKYTVEYGLAQADWKRESARWMPTASMVV